MDAHIKIDLENKISIIDERIYSSFIEHMGRAVYTGIYEPTHPTANNHGFRQDVIDLIEPLHVPLIRYPGGNFLSGYFWEDGIGKKETRPVRPELAWFAIEPNQVGTDDFMKFCASAGVSPMLGVNLGTRGPQDAANMLEYCNFPGGTYYSELRKANGNAEPYNVKTWCLGNEMDGPWQICAKTAEEYGRTACETAKMMKWLDPTIELVVCGSSYKSMPTFGEWERTVLRHCYPYVDYISLHQYYENKEGSLPNFLAKSVEMDGFIDEVATICQEAKQLHAGKHDVYLSFDEWNVWYHAQQERKEPPKWTVARPIEEESFDFIDALLVGTMLNTIINHTDTVKIACLAQLVNVIAPIMTEPGGRAWVQTIYYPFFYASRYGRGTALRVQADSPSYSCNVSDAVPYLDCAAVLSENGQEITLFAVNRSETDALETTLILPDTAVLTEWLSLSGFSPDAVNTADCSSVLPEKKSCAPVERGSLRLSIPALSWNMLRFEI